MLQLNYIREEKEKTIQKLAKRGFDASSILSEVISLDKDRKKNQLSLDDVLAQSNKIAKEIGKLFKNGEIEKANAAKAQTTALKEETKALQEKQAEINQALQDLLVQIPNIPHDSVPAGKQADDNEVVSENGEIPILSDKNLPHWELAKKYDLIDFELGTKITGAGFPVYKGKGARLQRALINFFLDRNVEAGYQEVQPPHLVNKASGLALDNRTKRVRCIMLPPTTYTLFQQQRCL